MATANTTRRSGRGRRSGSSKSSAPIVVEAPPPSRQQIRERAYLIYLARGSQGDPVSDWLQAERELIAEARAAEGVRG